MTDPNTANTPAENKPFIRATVERAIVSGVTHVLTLVFALVFLGLGGVIIWYNRTALTIPLLVAALVCFVLAMALAIPTNFKQVLIFVTPYLPDSIVGGRRKTDPPANP